MRILFLHEVGYLEKPIFEMHEFPEILASRGNSIAFLDFPEEKCAPERNSYDQLISGRVRRDSRLRLFSQRPRLPGILGRLVAVVEFPAVFQRVMREFKPHVVVSYSVPTSGWQALLICKHLGVPFVYRALDVSHKIRRTIFSIPVTWAERFVYRNASWVSTNNPAMLKYCLSEGADLQRSSVELPPLDLDHFLGASGKERNLRKALGISSKDAVVLYLGTFFYFSGLNRVIEDLSQLNEGIHLVLIGGGESEEELRSLVRSLGLESKVTFTGFVDFEDLPAYLSIADVAINPMEPGLVSHSALPNKVLQYMAAGLPVISTRLRGLEGLFSDATGLLLVSQPSDILSAAVDLLRDVNFGELGARNRQEVLRLFGPINSIEKFESVLARLAHTIE